LESSSSSAFLNRAAQTIRAWATERQIQRLRADRRLGLPEKEQVAAWVDILASRGIEESRGILAVLDAALVGADRSGRWRHWSYLTLQIQLAAERLQPGKTATLPATQSPREPEKEDRGCEWVAAKAAIQAKISETAFLNWFAPTRQVDRLGSVLTVLVPDEPTRCCLLSEYGHITKSAVSSFGIEEVRFVPTGCID
jgi:hypothetical protein